MNMFIQKSELLDWFSETPNAKKYLSFAYQETISDINKEIIKDWRVTQNNHIVNPGFAHDPQYVLGFNQDPNQPILIIGLLYVFSHCRNKGVARNMLSELQKSVGKNGVIQIAVESKSMHKLSKFYDRCGFQTTGVEHVNAKGIGYVDYFWSGKQFKLHNTPTGTEIEPC